MAKNSDERDGNRSSHWEGDGGVAEKTTDRTGRKTETRARDEDEDKEKGFNVSRKTLIIGGICVGVVLIGVLLYWLHARNFESTDDAYTTTHVHEISARVAGAAASVTVEDNQLVQAGSSPLGLLSRGFI